MARILTNGSVTRSAASSFLLPWVGLVLLPWVGGMAAGQGSNTPSPIQFGQIPKLERLPETTFEDIARKVVMARAGIRSGHFVEVISTIDPHSGGARDLRSSKVESWQDGDHFRSDTTLLKNEWADLPERAGKQNFDKGGTRGIFCLNYLQKGQVLRDNFADNTNSIATIIPPPENPKKELANQRFHDPRYVGLDMGLPSQFGPFQGKDLFFRDSREKERIVKTTWQGLGAYQLEWEMDLKERVQCKCVVVPGRDFSIVQYRVSGRGTEEWIRTIDIEQVGGKIWFPKRVVGKFQGENFNREEWLIQVEKLNGQIDPIRFQAEGMGFPKGKKFSRGPTNPF